jgi:hypothetical protein
VGLAKALLERRPRPRRPSARAVFVVLRRSAEIEEQIDAVLAVGVGENPREALSELASLGARVIIQRAIEIPQVREAAQPFVSKLFPRGTKLLRTEPLRAPDGPKEDVLVAWGFTEAGERVLLAVMLGMRESHEDWLALGRDLIARGLGAPMLIVADGAPG